MNEYKLGRDIQARIEVLESIRRETARDITQLCPDNYMRKKALKFLDITMRAAVKSLDDIPLGVSSGERIIESDALEAGSEWESERQLQEAATPQDAPGVPLGLDGREDP